MIDNQFAKFGRSGCKLELKFNGLIVSKKSSSISYNNRLYSQYIKQKNFLSDEYFLTPNVYEFDDMNQLHSFDMQYIYGKSFEQYCIDSNVNEINIFSNALIKFVKNNLEKSIRTKINFAPLEQKILSLRSILDPSLHRYIDFLLRKKIEYMPVGPNHGDLTMSNIIFSNKYYLIDFLDNIYETPLNDLVKIRQDTEHKFYINLLNSDNSKVETCLNYIDEQIKINFSEIITTLEYIWLSIFSLLRVLPYLKNEREKQTIINGIKKYEYYITSSREIE